MSLHPPTTPPVPAAPSGPVPSPSRPASRRPSLGRVRGALLVLLGLLAGAGLGIAAPSSAGDAHAPSRVAGATIVEVSGDAGNGFTIQRLDGTMTFPPTDSEARAECGEYDRRVARVRCRTQVRQWYRDLAAMRATIDYYQGLLD